MGAGRRGPAAGRTDQAGLAGPTPPGLGVAGGEGTAALACRLATGLSSTSACLPCPPHVPTFEVGGGHSELGHTRSLCSHRDPSSRKALEIPAPAACLQVSAAL